CARGTLVPSSSASMRSDRAAMDGTPTGSPNWPPNSPRAAEPDARAQAAGPAGAVRPGAAILRRGDLAGNVTLFGRRLRRRGLLVGPLEISDGLRAMTAVDLADRDLVRFSLRAVFCSHAEDLPVFDEEFARFWQGPPMEGAPAPQDDAAEGPAGTAGEAGGERGRDVAVAEGEDRGAGE